MSRGEVVMVGVLPDFPFDKKDMEKFLDVLRAYSSGGEFEDVLEGACFIRDVNGLCWEARGCLVKLFESSPVFMGNLNPLGLNVLLKLGYAAYGIHCGVSGYVFCTPHGGLAYRLIKKGL